MLRTVTLLTIFSTVFVLSACSSSQRSSATHSTVVAQQSIQKPELPKLAFTFSSSGFGDKPPDAITVDTNHRMSFKSRVKTMQGTWKSIEGMAILEEPDYEALFKIVQEGKLLDMEPADVTTNCNAGEYYTLVLSSTERKEPLRLTYSTCSLEYNLLVEPQRAAFAKLVDWFERQRMKYRPGEPTN